MKILFTGARGFIGKLLALMVKDAGHEVITLESELADREAWCEELQLAVPDAIVHLAALDFIGHAYEKAFYAVNVIGATNLLDALVQLPKALIQVVLAHSAYIYGSCKTLTIDKNQTLVPLTTASWAT